MISFSRSLESFLGGGGGDGMGMGCSGVRGGLLIGYPELLCSMSCVKQNSNR